MSDELKIIKESLPLIRENEDVELAGAMAELLVVLIKKTRDEFELEELENIEKELDVYNFRYFKEAKVLSYFLNGFQRVLQEEDISFIVDSIRYILYSFPPMNDYLLMREKILQNLYDNKNKLTKNKIRYDNGRELKGSVQNWFKHYQSQFDHKKDFRVGMMEYLNNSKALKLLEEKEKNHVKGLIYLVEFLRSDIEEIFSQDVDLIYDFGDGKRIGYSNGEAVVYEDDPQIESLIASAESFLLKGSTKKKEENSKGVQSKDNKKSERKVIKRNVNVNKIIKQKIQLSEEELINFRHMIQKYRAIEDSEIMNYFWEGLDSYNKYMLMGAMQELIHRKQWGEIWEISRLRLLLNDYRSRKLKQLAVDPKNVKENLKVLLSFLLESHLSLPIANARKWELYLVNLLVKNGYSEYKDLIYFDSESQKLKWEEK